MQIPRVLKRLGEGCCILNKLICRGMVIFFRINRRQHTAKVMSDTIDELESEFEDEDEDHFDSTLAANKFRELMSALDVEEGTQELALAILKEEGLHAVQVK